MYPREQTLTRLHSTVANSAPSYAKKPYYHPSRGLCCGKGVVGAAARSEEEEKRGKGGFPLFL